MVPSLALGCFKDAGSVCGLEPLAARLFTSSPWAGTSSASIQWEAEQGGSLSYKKLRRGSSCYSPSGFHLLAGSFGC